MLWAMLAEAAVQAPATPTIQQQFDAAAEAGERHDWAAALAGYQALEARLRQSPRSLAIVRVRKGDALYKLDRYAEAQVALAQGLADLPDKDESLRADRFTALLTLASIQEAGLDFPAAKQGFAAADAIAPTNGAHLRTLAGLIRVTMFDDPAAAIADADRALALVAQTPDASKQLRAEFRTLKGRALLNKGDTAAARTDLNKAMNELGGLTMRVDQSDITARSDLSIASLLAGDPGSARKYMAYTGAGTMGVKDLGTGADTPLPPCGGEGGLKPDDVAVIGFAIGADGTVIAAAPVYASRPGIALIFARTVAGWTWTTDAVKAMPPFFRLQARVEIRCSTAVERPEVTALLNPPVNQWLASHGVTAFAPATDLPASEQLSQVRAELARRERQSGASSLSLIPMLFFIIRAPATSFEESKIALDRFLTILGTGDTPAAVVAFRALMVTHMQKGSREKMLAPVRAALADATVRADPLASGVLRLYLADIIDRRQPDEALKLLIATADDASLGAHDPLKVGALIRIAAIRVRAGDLAAARAAYERTGLTEQQCALVDARPGVVRANNGSGAYPVAAAQWGFEGWVQTEFDINAAGIPGNVRTVIAYPPFIFGDAAKAVIAKSRFEQSYRPAGGLGCGGQGSRVRFGVGHK